MYDHSVPAGVPRVGIRYREIDYPWRPGSVSKGLFEYAVRSQWCEHRRTVESYLGDTTPQVSGKGQEPGTKVEGLLSAVGLEREIIYVIRGLQFPSDL